MAFVLWKEREYGALARGRRGIQEAVDYLNTLVDESDPDTDLSQIEHLLQTSEAIRADGHPRWFILAGFLHDLGKVLCLYGEPQWAVVGDTLPVGCCVIRSDRFPRLFRTESGFPGVRLSEPVRHLRAALRSRKRAPFLGV